MAFGSRRRLPRVTCPICPLRQGHRNERTTRLLPWSSRRTTLILERLPREITGGSRSSLYRPAASRVYHHLPHRLAGLHDRAIGLHCNAPRHVDAHGSGALSLPGAVLDENLCRVLRYG